MDTVGLRDLRQRASDVVRRVQAGETITVTVSGRPAARLVPVLPNTWGSYADVVDIVAGPEDEAWERDRARLDETIRDPWQQP